MVDQAGGEFDQGALLWRTVGVLPDFRVSRQARLW
ncbi:hypothetical protein MPEAHAMD_3382 [Methylobacterium frigidaeris]|uniref:Uncharacterized protein n=1 Tax=Methylobacterium frigidaeris TaxID=2038277 RepID=A0AA37M526_9HYPH|nr:hypothetical protein MPEAHAMD_3382 [Methylobacterium frigidaeris]